MYMRARRDEPPPLPPVPRLCLRPLSDTMVRLFTASASSSLGYPPTDSAERGRGSTRLRRRPPGEPLSDSESLLSHRRGGATRRGAERLGLSWRIRLDADGRWPLRLGGVLARTDVRGFSRRRLRRRPVLLSLASLSLPLSPTLASSPGMNERGSLRLPSKAKLFTVAGDSFRFFFRRFGFPLRGPRGESSGVTTT